MGPPRRSPTRSMRSLVELLNPEAVLGAVKEGRREGEVGEAAECGITLRKF